jgi:hypothetical protein
MIISYYKYDFGIKFSFKHDTLHLEVDISYVELTFIYIDT